MMNTRRCLSKALLTLFVSVFVLFSVSIVFAQDPPPSMLRFGVGYIDSDVGNLDLFDIRVGEINFTSLPAGLLTAWTPIAAGDHTVQFLAQGSTITIPETQITVESGNQYTIYQSGIDQPAIVINHTVLDEESPRAEGENEVIAISDQPETIRRLIDALRPIAEEISARERYARFSLSDFREINVPANLERIDPQTGDQVFQISIPYFPATNVFLDANWNPNGSAPLYLNYTTPLSTFDWLTAVNSMPNPPFTFNQFLNTANVGGFAGALQRCEDYSWQVWTDAAYNALSPELQSVVTRSPAVVMDNSVLQRLTTSPWTVPQTTTRGGTPITYLSPSFFGFGADSTTQVPTMTPQSGQITGRIMLTVTTTGSEVRNNIHVTDLVPVGFDPREGAIIYRPDGTLMVLPPIEIEPPP